MELFFFFEGWLAIGANLKFAPVADHLQIFSHWVYIGSWSATGSDRPLDLVGHWNFAPLQFYQKAFTKPRISVSQGSNFLLYIIAQWRPKINADLTEHNEASDSDTHTLPHRQHWDNLAG